MGETPRSIDEGWSWCGNPKRRTPAEIREKLTTKCDSTKTVLFQVP